MKSYKLFLLLLLLSYNLFGQVGTEHATQIEHGFKEITIKKQFVFSEKKNAKNIQFVA